MLTYAPATPLLINFNLFLLPILIRLVQFISQPGFEGSWRIRNGEYFRSIIAACLQQSRAQHLFITAWPFLIEMQLTFFCEDIFW